MKRCARIGVFETNSSSVDTLSINKEHRGYMFDIPKNTDIRVHGVFNHITCYFDELGKLNIILSMLETIYLRRHPECRKYNEPKDPELLFSKMVESDWFVWLAEVVKEESNSTIIYEPGKTEIGLPEWYHPFYGEVYDSNHSVEEIFTAGKTEILTDKETFKAHVKELIYDPDVFINKYSSEL